VIPKSKVGIVIGFGLAAGILFFIVLHKNLIFKPGATIMNSNDIVTLENFDNAWSLGYPDKVETKLREFLPQAQALQDKSIYLQLLSQIALAQAMQKKFNEAHKTLDLAESMLTPEYDLAKARILLERGRTFQQANNITEAQDYFERSYALSAKNKFDSHAINAAHMIAIIADKNEDKIKWNQRAIDLALHTQDTKARAWLGSIYNNLGQNYLSEEQFDKALIAFQKALEYRIEEAYAPNIRIAKWAIARALRSLNHLDEALAIQHELLNEYKAISKSENYEVPVEIFKLVRGLVYEELAELYQAKAKEFARSAYDDLAHDQMFLKTEPKRIERLKQMIG
jgi:tetratricopeptide (TPR) repeat protein